MVKIGQFLTFLPVSSSELEKRPSLACFIVGHREAHEEKSHISLNKSSRAAES